MENSSSVHGFRSVAISMFSFESIGKLSFILYIFFVFFGTEIPFYGQDISLSSYGSNPTRQLVFGVIYFLAFVSILPAMPKVISIIKEEKFITIFMLWTLISIFWSDYSVISFKRWLQIFGSYIVCLAGLVRFLSSEDMLRLFKIIAYTYLIVNIISVIAIPAATVNYEGQTVWRGIANQKNGLGQMVLVCSIICAISIKYCKSNFYFLDYLMLLIAIILLMGSKSVTSILTALILLSIASYISIKVRYVFGGLMKWFAYLTVVEIILFVVAVTLFYPSIINDIFLLIGKDPSFTGRTDLWEYLIDIASSGNIFLGSGFGGFWVYGSPNLLFLYSLLNDTPIQAHNGYVDLFIEIGLVGIMILFLIIIWYFYNLNRTNDNKYWKYLFIATLFINLQEATLFKLNATTSVLFIFSYIFLFSQTALNRKDL